MQVDHDLTELIDLEFQNGYSRRWTTTNQQITYTLSGTSTKYDPFPGMSPGGLEISNNLQVAVVDFVMQNTGSMIAGLIENDFSLARLKVGRVFVGTPNLGRMEIYNGQIGDFTYNRIQLKGQARNIWKSLSIQFPYYQYQDTCVWRFGSTNCGVTASSFSVSISSVLVSSSSVLAITAASGTISQSYAAGRFDFGRVIGSVGANSGFLRTIRVHTGDLLTLGNGFPFAISSGDQFIIQPGCRKRAMDDCKSIYNNDKNFFGFPWIIPTPLPRFKVK
jgi:uncharacterized phage protein (TIGR02218 family)